MYRRGPWRRDPSVPWIAVQNELNRLFDEIWRPRASQAAASATEDMADVAWEPAIDVSETPEAYLVVADLPGVDPATIELSLTGGVLTLRGEKPPLAPSEGNAVRSERAVGPFARQVTLSADVDPEAVVAEARHGVLSVRLSKRQAVRPRTIPIQPA